LRDCVDPHHPQAGERLYDQWEAITHTCTKPGDTWIWDGHQWKQVVDTGPEPRIGHAMASDGLVVILFGGERLPPDASPRIVKDTWAWYDQTWRQIQDIGPQPRGEA
jgi:hypothetical protein